MNYKMIFYVLARMLKLLAGLLVVPMIVSLIYKEPSNVTVAFLAASIISFVLYSTINTITDDDSERDFYKREGFVIVTLTWIASVSYTHLDVYKRQYLYFQNNLCENYFLAYF